MHSAVEVWVKRQQNHRRANHSDFVVEAAYEKLKAEGILVVGQQVLRTGEQRGSAYPSHQPTHDALNEVAQPPPPAENSPIKKVSYRLKRKKKSGL